MRETSADKLLIANSRYGSVAFFSTGSVSVFTDKRTAGNDAEFDDVDDSVSVPVSIVLLVSLPLTSDISDSFFFDSFRSCSSSSSLFTASKY